MRSVHVSRLPEYNTDPLIVPNIICFSLISHKNSRLIVVDAKDIINKLLYKSNAVNPNDSPVTNVCFLLFNNHYYHLTSLSAWYSQHYYCIECEVRYNSKHTCNPVIHCSKCSENNCQPLPTFTRC